MKCVHPSLRAVVNASRMFNTQHWPRNSVLSHGSTGQSTAQRAEVLARLKLIKAEVRLEKELQGRTNALIRDLRSKLDMLGDGDEIRSTRSTRSNARSARSGIHQQSGVNSSSFGRGSRSSLDGPYESPCVRRDSVSHNRA